MSSNQLRLDGIAIESHSGRFSGTFDVEDNVGPTLHLGDQVFAIVVATIQPPAHKYDSNNDLKRIHVLAPGDVQFITSPDAWNQIMEIVAEEDASGRLFPRISLNTPESDDSDDFFGNFSYTQTVDEETGEILSSSEPNATDRPPDSPSKRDFRRDPEVTIPSNGERVGSEPAGSKDPVLRRFLEETTPSAR